VLKVGMKVLKVGAKVLKVGAKVLKGIFAVVQLYASKGIIFACG